MIDKKIEALLDGISHLKGASNPDSITYQIKNPLHIRSFGLPGRHEIDEEGRRVFSSWLAGYRACLYDLKVKLTGESRSKLKTTDPLSYLLNVYDIKEKLGQQQVVRFVRRALKDESVQLDTPLNYFVQD
jgi:hypothetical protein